jgi:hypothetical protein
MRGANLNMDLPTGYGIALFAAFLCRDDGNRMTKFISGGSILPTPEMNKEAQTVTKERLKVASYLISELDIKAKADIFYSPEELQRKISLLADDQLTEHFDTDNLAALLELIYDPLFITDNSCCFAQNVLKRLARKLFLQNRVKLKHLLDKVSAFSADIALGCLEELAESNLR